MLMITDPEISKDPKNKLINPWPKRNPIALDKIMINVRIKWAIDLERKESRPNEDVSSMPTKYEACQVNKISLDKYDKAK